MHIPLQEGRSHTKGDVPETRVQKNIRTVTFLTLGHVKKGATQFQRLGFMDLAVSTPGKHGILHYTMGTNGQTDIRSEHFLAQGFERR